MITLNYIFKNMSNFEMKLSEQKISLKEECLVQIYTANLTEAEAVELAQEIKNKMPAAKIIGASASGVINNGEQYDKDTLIIVEKFEKAEVVTGSFSWDRSTEELVEDVLAGIKDKQPKTVRVLFGDYCSSVYPFVETFNEKSAGVILAGGLAGETCIEDGSCFVFTPEGVVRKGLVTVAICGKDVKAYNSINNSQEPLSPVYTITKCEDNVIREIEGIPAYEWLEKNLGLSSKKIYKDWKDAASHDPLARFPIVVEGHNGATRYMRYDETLDEIALYFCGLPTGTRFRIGYTSPIRCVEECHSICDDIAQVPIESLFCYSCRFRKIYLGNCAEWELSPFRDANICGAFMLCEIGMLNGRSELLNGSCVINGVAENETYIMPDMDVFENLYKIENDNRELLEFVLKRQTQVVSDENRNLLDKVIEQQDYYREQLYKESNLGLYNLIKFEEDKKLYKFDKLCLISVENADTLIGYMGQQEYYDYLKQIIKIMTDYMKKKGYDAMLRLYALNSHTFAIAAGDSLTESYFTKIAQKLYKNYQIVKLDVSSPPVITSFVVVLHQKNLVECGFNAMQANRNSQVRFVICDADTSDRFSINQELSMIGILKDALDGDGVVPYYQGIYDNHAKKINKYEALMRIQDRNGNIYTPNQFLDIAKKYHLYLSLTERMIDRVFTDFETIDGMVTINLSASDIASEQFRKNLMTRLKSYPEPSKIIFEILEDEGFKEIEVLKQFIRDIETYGAKIAIDDFGSGYSNLLEVVKIKPDYIKVDGEIVKDVHRNDQNRIVLETIVSLAKRLSVQLVAEFVENLEIQKEMEKMEIDYSQGYYFSKPMPFLQRTV